MPQANPSPRKHPTLGPKDIVRNKYGELVSEAQSKLGKQNAWALAVKQSRKEAGVTGFLAVNPRGDETQKIVYRRAKELHPQKKKAVEAKHHAKKMSAKKEGKKSGGAQKKRSKS